ncbi:putative Gnk2-like domain-containing protein [Helianthus annuus]|nr:putative Gnk2-like domain-containing protein [Helianthus annuus]KAJ0583129.1 putative Gnk2-like domain-containing protein [Helianthus annuus]
MEKFMFWAMLFIMSGCCHVDGVTYLDSECSQAQNSTGNSVYRSNLKSLLNSLATNAPLQDGFFNTSVGNGTDRVYGLAWCRADASPDTCSKCLNGLISAPLSDCPDMKDLVTWSSTCSLRFSNESFFGELWNSSSSTYGGNSGLDDPAVFTRGFSMMEMLVRNVSSRPMMFATDVIDVGDNGERYGLGQCSRDLSKLDCENCLEELLTSYHDFVLNRTGWEMVGVSCGMWYDDFRFYDNNSSRPNPTANTSGTRFLVLSSFSLTGINYLFITLMILLIHGMQEEKHGIKKET